ncbi:hypothetical protein LC612_23380 [Nostoc sp. CHAB 5834]|nr:hypothetical protein [Nostoc sp. CHAB 5834]
MQSIHPLTDIENWEVSGTDEKMQFSGVQFLINFLGQKTGVLIDLKQHGELWAAMEEETDIPLTVEFLVDEQGYKTAVLLDFEEHGEIWEDIYYNLIALLRIDEPKIPLAEVKRSLNEQGKLSG